MRCYKCKERCAREGLKFSRVPIYGGYYYDIDNDCLLFELKFWRKVIKTLNFWRKNK